MNKNEDCQPENTAETSASALNNLVSRRDKKAMVKAVKRMKKYWNTYDQQVGFEGFSVETFLDDALYAIGIAIDDKEYKYVDGYQKFKNILREQLGG